MAAGKPHSLRLVVFDLDGTLVDSQATIVACTQAAFAAAGLAVPSPESVRRIVGLSLAEAMAELLGSPDPARAASIAELYRQAFLELRARPEFEEPLFPGVVEMLEGLETRGLTMGVATGKAMRGLRHVLERHSLGRFFTTLQTADRHPSKPHPSMLETASAETGIAVGAACMIGDTTFDMMMARAAGMGAVGVAWGNHPPEELLASGVDHMLGGWPELIPWLDTRAGTEGCGRLVMARAEP